MALFIGAVAGWETTMELEVIFMDAGQGDVTLIRCPDGTAGTESRLTAGDLVPAPGSAGTLDFLDTWLCSWAIASSWKHHTPATS